MNQVSMTTDECQRIFGKPEHDGCAASKRADVLLTTTSTCVCDWRERASVGIRVFGCVGA